MHVRHGKLITPDLQSSVLESITREALLVLAREQLGMQVEERIVDRTELYTADEVFICGTAAEITPIVAIDKFDIGTGKPGEVTRELEKVFNAALRGTSDDYREWRTPVGARATVSA